MHTIRERNLPGGWTIKFIEDARRDRWFEIYSPAGAHVASYGLTSKLYRMYDDLLAESPVIDDKELIEIYEKTTEGISHKYGRTLAFARAVIARAHATMKEK